MKIELRREEYWWGGAVADGQAMPFGDRPLKRNLATSAGLIDDDEAGANQSAPLLISNAGRWVWSNDAFSFAFDGLGGLEINGHDLQIGEADASLAAAFRGASQRHFPPAGKSPDPLMFSGPQYNTWIEMPYEPTQRRVLAYAQGVLDAGFPPGVIMIDDRWSRGYGDWTFDPTRFPDPASMCDDLHSLGFATMVWLVPFVDQDTSSFTVLDENHWLVTGPDGNPVIRHWWNGDSAILDLTSPAGLEWLRKALAELQQLGIDGFKFDAGDLRDYRPDDVTVGGRGGLEQCEAWARLAGEFAFNELRACWKSAGQPLAQRLHDKPPTWGRGGLGSLIPEGIAQGLIGHPYNCPDMIGGGDLAFFSDGVPIDQELFVRSTQVASLFPMMQFSLAPWCLLDAAHLSAVQGAVALRQRLVPDILRLVEHAARTGEPILRPMAYHFTGYELVQDQFMLGPDLLVAPVLERAATTRTALLPAGRWQASDGTISRGPKEVELDIDLHSIPWWRRLS